MAKRQAGERGAPSRRAEPRGARPRLRTGESGPTADPASVATCCAALAGLAPLELAESWDNVGLLAGDLSAPVRRVLLCIDLTEAVAAEALACAADLVVAYHPPIFKPVARLVRPGPTVEAAVVALLSRGIALYATHTALDAAPLGTNDVLADLCGLCDVHSLGEPPSRPTVGRVGHLDPALPLGALGKKLARRAGARGALLVGDRAGMVKRAFVVAGSGARIALGAGPRPGDVVVTGELSHHDALALVRTGASAVALGHFSSERPVLASFGARLGACLPGVAIAVSERDAEPFAPVFG